MQNQNMLNNNQKYYTRVATHMNLTSGFQIQYQKQHISIKKVLLSINRYEIGLYRTIVSLIALPIPLSAWAAVCAASVAARSVFPHSFSRVAQYVAHSRHPIRERCTGWTSRSTYRAR